MAMKSEMEKKKAEVRARLEAQSASRKKKGFMTPERKKKLRILLRKKAAEELKKEQERKSEERRRVIDQRCGQPKNVDTAAQGDLLAMCKEYYSRIVSIESTKYDLEKEVEFKDYQINELNIAVNDLRGKFIKPTLKKVSKYENKFAKLQKKAAEFNFRNQLKTVKKKEFTMDEEDPGKRPDWALGEKDGKAKAGGTEHSQSEAHSATPSNEPEASEANVPDEVHDDEIECADNQDDSALAADLTPVAEEIPA
ncbi:hypothetical protein TCAL_06972 [Tigriopus californicus]|uniref:Troponin I n=1 Tax=Tigriopus californicus TaxID=6832 RepID=A0A553P6Z1_TIGCA|nr:hypothetical protein TCAL_06972 [Tigriopus californicus]